MKKILGILGTTTITGSGMTGLVGNVPVLTKNEINYLQRYKKSKNKPIIIDSYQNKIEITPIWTDLEKTFGGLTTVISNTISIVSTNNQQLYYLDVTKPASEIWVELGKQSGSTIKVSNTSIIVQEFKTDELWYLDFSNPYNPVWTDVGKKVTFGPAQMSNTVFIILEKDTNELYYLDVTKPASERWVDLGKNIMNPPWYGRVSSAITFIM
ncbi:hypothetical protein [Spiroplasma endosymbiont of 'Nebria riversi']|uniref:hypothetical protein n=1 Tax=Spiroplasma endosymbiont of 'Nebria riversi' TaxID=2792084 RepID=UPI001C04C07C|nr:hypothetical protein [Spiroplasma endosymbiont of 'Nebria riversi']